MSTQPQEQTLAPVWAQVDAAGDSKLAQLHAAYEATKAEADAAAERHAAVKDQVKAALAAQAPEGSTKIELRTPGCTPLTLVHSESWRVDARALKAADPETYVRYAVKSDRWTLAAARGQQGGES